MILLDTNVLVYAVGDDHALRAGCRRVLKLHLDGAIQAVTTVEVIQEFAHVRARRRRRDDAVDLATQYAELIPLVGTDGRDLRLGLSLFKTHQRIGAFDAVLAAVAINRQFEGLASTDDGFDDVPGLRRLDPASLPTPLS